MKKPRATRDIPPPLELECLRALWTLGEANVQAVRSQLEPHRPLAYTTVMTMLDRLARKQAVTRRKSGRSFLYTPLLSREQVRRLAVKELLDTLFDGSSGDLIDYLNGRPAAAQEDQNGAFAAAIDDTLL
ncbi:MAG: BlaI/MecI/CopY family transcriptional regulator [Bryobacteraceae bacterium]|nr:BlaI/MecI/CopY family transcriptional regulator [Bryobacteraceae bacterium]